METHTINTYTVTINPQKRDKIPYLGGDTLSQRNDRLRQYLATSNRDIVLIVNEEIKLCWVVYHA